MKWALFLGALGPVPILLMGVCSAYKYHYPNSSIFLLNYTFIYVLTIIFSVICGCSYIIILIGVNEYITNCANMYNKGLYNSIVYASMMIAMVIGSIASAIVIGGSSYETFLFVNIGLTCLSAITLLFLTKPKVDTTRKMLEEKNYNSTNSTLSTLPSEDEIES
jgi:MFS family permease